MVVVVAVVVVVMVLVLFVVTGLGEGFFGRGLYKDWSHIDEKDGTK